MSGSSPSNPYGQNPYGQDPRGPEVAQDPYGAAPQNPYGEAPQPAEPTAYPAQPTSYPSQPGQPGAYPAQPGQPNQPGAWPAAGMPAPARPGSITAAFWLILAGGLVLLTTLGLGVLAGATPEGRALLEQQLRDSVAQAGLPAEQAAEMESVMVGAVPTVLTGMAVFGVLAFLLYLLIAFKIRGGSRAARTVGTVFAVLSVLLLLGSIMTGGLNPLDVLWVVLGVAGIVMAYRKDATEFMRLKAWERAGR